MGYEQYVMDLSGVYSRNHVRQAEPYKPGEGMIAQYGAGPEKKHCATCKHYVAAESCCRIIPMVKVKYRGRACGKYEGRR